ncbi:MAG: hypothetical protein NPIRA05_23160 [Nitrospirales bacterium]|nr:MAG: hypothetical protein NPIRA05_23160 [Nitrospirales bacterium]
MGDQQVQCFSKPSISNQPNFMIKHQDSLWKLTFSFLSCMLLFSSTHAFADTAAMEVTESTLTVPYTGSIPKGPLIFPLYKGEGFEYFTAGVGLEERQLTYPSYPVKLILVQGSGAFLSNVAITVHQLDGPVTFDIPATQVEGPWVFLNIPTGTYVLKATNSQQQLIEKQIDVVQNQQKILHLRW